jgi:hypothetical protein
MTLSALIRKRSPDETATAIPAIPATQQGQSGRTVATVATIAVANRTGSEVAPLPDSASESRRLAVLATLSGNPTARLATITDPDCDPEFVILAIALRDKATFEMRVPKAKYDPFLLYDLIHRHFGTVQ